MIPSSNVPHPFPYQGSKRRLAKQIFLYLPSEVDHLIEPFCGTGAVSIAAAAQGRGNHFTLNDANKPLMDLWREILEHPQQLCDEYEWQWHEQHSDKKSYFLQVRAQFNATHRPHQLLYLLARTIKGSIRYNADGDFNQSADNRRCGMHPKTMRQNILAVSTLLNGKTSISAVDFRITLNTVTEYDFVYLDPPYQGTSTGQDSRYSSGVSYDELVAALFDLNARNITYMVSYDGAMGNKSYGNLFPQCLELQHMRLHAGRSSQATLLGKTAETIESLYLSSALIQRLGGITRRAYPVRSEQLAPLLI